IGVVPSAEPYNKRTSHGMILGENGEKMSKSRGNVVNPDDIINEYGADTMRLYEMFIGDFEKAAPWSSSSIKGCRRFLDRVVSLADMVVDGGLTLELESDFHKTIKKVSEDIDSLKMNTAIAALMTLLNSIFSKGSITHQEYKVFLTLLNPFAPHITEELWEQCGYEGMLNQVSWPEFDESKCKQQSVEIVAQINGKIKAKLTVETDISNEAVIELVKSNEKISAEISGKTIIKELYIKNKLVNIVVK
ncbi:MAG: class I tRNA ligase family protein, partial [bacterium]|nr:class I tRNA ligase family protein [bacterium]